MSDGIRVTRLTAKGRGAVAVLQVDVEDEAGAATIDQHFSARNGTSASTAETNRILYGHWGLEDVVVVRVAHRRWEVNCHGGEAAVQRIMEDLLGLALTPFVLEATSKGQFESRLHTALLQRLLQCRTQQTASYLLAQQQGVLQHFLQQLQTVASKDAANAMMERFLRWRRFAEHLTEPWQVAIVGQPNAGKSSLLNAIVGFERSIVFDQPGTTRDRVEADIVLAGWPFRLIDTAGIRAQAQDTIESFGVDAARTSARECDACLIVVDATLGWTDVDTTLHRDVPADCPVAVLWNKTDLVGARPVGPVSFQRDVIVIETSAATGIGIEQLTAWLPQRLIPEEPDLAEPLPVIADLVCLAEDFLNRRTLNELKAAVNEWL